jgi:hypothetical protein
MNPESKDESNRRPRERYRCPAVPILRMANKKTLEERNLPHRKALEEFKVAPETKQPPIPESPVARDQGDKREAICQNVNDTDIWG